MMVKIHRLMIRVITVFLYAVCDDTIHTVRAAGQNVYDTQSLVSFLPAAFYLVRRYRAAPEEVIRQCLSACISTVLHTVNLLFRTFYFLTSITFSATFTCFPASVVMPLTSSIFVTM